MAFEILLARMLSNYSHNYVLAQSLTLSVFIAGLGSGSYLFKFVKNKTTQSLVKIEMLLYFVSLLGFFTVQAGQIYTNTIDWQFESKNLFLTALTQAFVFLVALLAGMEIPFFVQFKKHENKFGLILALSYFGSFLASFVTVAALLPVLGLYNTYNLILLLVLVSCYLLTLAGQKRNRLLLSVLLLSFMNAGFFKYAKNLEQIYLKNYYYGTPVNEAFWKVSSLPEIERHSTPYQEIDVVPDLFSFYSQHNYYLYIDQKLQYASSREGIYHESMVHGALNLSRSEPLSVLVLGGGEGLIVRELLKYKNIKNIDLVELDQAILDLAETNALFLEHNQNALRDARVTLHVADAYMWLKNNSRKFDAIFIDLPHPYSVELARLFSAEFFTFANRSLASGGFVIFDYPANHILTEQLKYKPSATPALIYNTLNAAGFKNTFTFGPREAFIFANNSDTPLAFTEETLFSLVHDVTLSNLVQLPAPAVDEKATNSIFKPYFLTE